MSDTTSTDDSVDPGYGKRGCADNTRKNYSHREEIKQHTIADNSDLRVAVFVGDAVRIFEDRPGGRFDRS